MRRENDHFHCPTSELGMLLLQTGKTLFQYTFAHSLVEKKKKKSSHCSCSDFKCMICSTRQMGSIVGMYQRSVMIVQLLQG